MNCPYCSKELEDGAIICKHCSSAVMEPERLGSAEAAQESSLMDKLRRADIEELLKELEEAEAEAAPSTEAASPPASDEGVQHLERAFALEDEDEYEQALAECDAALRLDPTLAEAHNLRGVILEELGREKEALLAYRVALHLDPGFDAARENLEAVEAELAAHGRSSLPQKLLCTGRMPGSRQCPRQPIYTCQTCGKLLCYDHAMFLQVPGDDPSLRAYGGTYCHRHHRKLEAALAGKAPYWLWSLAYLPAFLGVTYLVFVVEGEWRFWVAGAVWLIGGLLGLLILSKKDAAELDKLDLAGQKLQGCEGGELVLLAFALCGPFILLVALLARSRLGYRASEAAVGHGDQLAQTTEAAQPTPISPPKGEDGRAVNGEQKKISDWCLVWSSVAGLVVGLVIGARYSALASDIHGEPPNLWVTTAVGLAVGAAVGAVVGAAVQWRKDRSAGMRAGAIGAGVVTSATVFFLCLFVLLVECCW